MNTIVELPDGKALQYDRQVDCAQVAADISPRLAKAAVAAKVDNRLCDLSAAVGEGRHQVRILTAKDPESLEILRHTTAHILAHAMVRLFGADVQYTIGPALTDDSQYGFYYDFDLPFSLGLEQLGQVEAEMQKIIDEKLPIERVELGTAEAIEMMQRLNQHYKVEMIQDLLKQENVAGVSLYRQGDFVDLCRGPHLDSTAKARAFKLLTIAGAYWRGLETNKMLTRIYGTAFWEAKELQQHIERIDQARKRDHRVLGKQLGLFLLNDQVGPGLPMWMPRGAVIRRQLENWLQGELVKGGYDIVYTPHIGKLDLYRTSGHYPYYKESQFPPIELSQQEGYLLKPMNCPHHIQIYKAVQHSYRDLPIRLAEFGAVYRWEQSGELNGLIRVRGFTQDDAHIFCTPEQVETEIESCVSLVKLVLGTLELNDYRVRISLRGDDGEKYVGDVEHWNRAEDNIRNVVRRLGMNYTEEPGEAAFYGPKIDFVVKDCIGREWQLGTIQVDYNLPERFELEYTGADNSAHRPVMIHRAPFGALERFIGILIEHFAGAFPLWLAPVQAAVLPVSDKFNDYADKVAALLRLAGLRIEADCTSEKIGAKIRRATMNKIPYMAVVGQREQEGETVSVRDRSQGDLGQMSSDAFAAELVKEVQSKGKTTLVTAAVS